MRRRKEKSTRKKRSEDYVEKEKRDAENEEKGR